MVCERKRNTQQTRQVNAIAMTLGSCDCALNLGGRMSDDKPFACKVPGCNQKFVNEDHLEVHRRKHDASLGIINLKSLDTPVIADQTPTPTRFLKHLAGEDVLFDSLPSNPFDVEFRKASTKLDGTEDVSDGHISMSDASTLSGGHGLHTSLASDSPVMTLTTMAAMQGITQGMVTGEEEEDQGMVTGVDAKMEEVTVQSEPGMAADITDSQEMIADMSLQQRPTTVVVVTQPPQPTASVANQTVHLSEQVAIGGLTGHFMIRLPTGQTIPIVPPSVTNPQEPIPTAVSANPIKERIVVSTSGKMPQNSAVKMKLKTTLLSNQSQGNMNVMAQAVDVVTRQQGVQLISQPISEPSPNSGGMKRQRSLEDEPEEKRQKFLERNRAAAMRCRNKRKNWIGNLEKRADDLTSSNVSLNNEVTKLRNEVAQLKELLLAHKDCPVTLQQRAAGLFVRVEVD